MRPCRPALMSLLLGPLLGGVAASDADACSPGDFPALSGVVPAQPAAPSVAGAAEAGGSIWSARGPLGTARQEVAVAELDGKIYVIGGIDGTPVFLPSVEVYDPASDAFGPGPPLPVPLHHTTASTVDGVLYVIGGWSDFFATPLDVVFALDPQLGSWVAKTSMPTARGSPAAAALDGKIYVAGGWPTERSRDFAVYDPASDLWQTLADLPSGRNHLALAAADGRIYAVGGRTALQAGVGNVASVDVFDPASGTWSPESPLPRARGGLAAVGFGRFVFAFGGEGNASSPDGTFEDADVYDSRTGEWTQLAPMPTPRHGIGAALLAGGIHIPGGGPIENFSVSDVHEVLDAPAALGAQVPLLPLLLAIALGLALAATGRRAR